MPMKDKMQDAGVDTDASRLFTLATNMLHADNKNPFVVHKKFVEAVRGDLGLLNALIAPHLPPIALNYLNDRVADMTGPEKTRGQSPSDAHVRPAPDEEGEVGHRAYDSQRVLADSPSSTDEIADQNGVDSHNDNVSKDEGVGQGVADAQTTHANKSSSESEKVDHTVAVTQKSHVAPSRSLRPRRPLGMPTASQKKAAAEAVVMASCSTGPYRIFSLSMGKERIGDQVTKRNKRMETVAHMTDKGFKAACEIILRELIIRSDVDPNLRIDEAFSPIEFQKMADEAYNVTPKVQAMLARATRANIAAELKRLLGKRAA